MIPEYPQSTALDFSHQEVFNQAFQQYPPQISEFTFTNLFSWRKAYAYGVSLFEGALILRSLAAEKPRFLPPIGTNNSVKIIEKVLEDTGGLFIRVPEDIAGFCIKNSHFNVDEDKDNWDYLYLASDLIDLSGRRYDGKRNQIKKFKSENDYAYIDIRTGEANLILEFEAAWCGIKDCDHVEGLNNEREMIRETIKHFADFKLKSGAIKIGGRVCAVAVAEALNSDTLVMHILKADPALAGLYQVMLNDFLRRHALDFKYINLEQDLGIAGLRAAKESYHPQSMIKKYTIVLKE